MSRPGRRFRVLFLCTGNSARSILAEHLLRRLDPGRFETWSAGSQPRGTVHPLALELLAGRDGVDARAARSKPWRELADTDLDLVVTVCDDARESCPLWPRATAMAHWGMADPAAVEGSEETRRDAFAAAARLLEDRLASLAALPLESMGPEQLEDQVGRIRNGSPPTATPDGAPEGGEPVW